MIKARIQNAMVKIISAGLETAKSHTKKGSGQSFLDSNFGCQLSFVHVCIRFYTQNDTQVRHMWVRYAYYKGSLLLRRFLHSIGRNTHPFSPSLSWCFSEGAMVTPLLPCPSLRSCSSEFVKTELVSESDSLSSRKLLMKKTFSMVGSGYERIPRLSTQQRDWKVEALIDCDDLSALDSNLF